MTSPNPPESPFQLWFWVNATNCSGFTVRRDRAPPERCWALLQEIWAWMLNSSGYQTAQTGWVVSTQGHSRTDAQQKLCIRKSCDLSSLSLVAKYFELHYFAILVIGEKGEWGKNNWFPETLRVKLLISAIGSIWLWETFATILLFFLESFFIVSVFQVKNELICCWLDFIIWPMQSEKRRSSVFAELVKTKEHL